MKYRPVSERTSIDSCKINLRKSHRDPNSSLHTPTFCYIGYSITSNSIKFYNGRPWGVVETGIAVKSFIT